MQKDSFIRYAAMLPYEGQYPPEGPGTGHRSPEGSGTQHDTGQWSKLYKADSLYLSLSLSLVRPVCELDHTHRTAAGGAAEEQHAQRRLRREWQPAARLPAASLRVLLQ